MLTERRFRDRVDAGRALAADLSACAGRDDVLVLALPRGGVPVGFEVARSLGAPLDVWSPAHRTSATCTRRPDATGGVMAKRLVLVVVASIAIGLAVGFAAGRLPGTGAFAAAFVLGAILVVLRRNQKDLRELEQGLVPPEVDEALGEPPSAGR